MSFYNKLDFLEIENSSICNARCPHCLREDKGDDKSWFKEEYLETEFFVKSIPDHIYNELSTIHFAGSIGDPCTAPNFLEVVETVKNINPNLKISVATNGGMKSASWWEKLAKALPANHEVIFGIDGLEDTNHIYRVNVNWNSLIKNVKAFIAAGGNATWQFIVFRHNEHQREQARSFATALGFKTFMLKKPHRFVQSEIKGIEIVGASQTKIEPPTDPEFVSEIKFVPNPATWKEQTRSLDISCISKNHQEAYIDVKGRLFPCCYIASGVYQYETKLGKTMHDGWDTLWNDHGDQHINLKTNDWSNIVSGEFFSQIESKWTSTNRIAICVLFCAINAQAPTADRSQL
jgi:sulfatase maturation enzyme AslB (radical SAM superfamily)